MRTFKELVESLYNGRSSFEEFARATREKWERYARYLSRKWRQPAWHDLEDVIQELLLGAWKAVWRFEPYDGGAPLERYVVYNALDNAKKACHRARGALMSGTQDKNPTNIERPFCTYEDEEYRKIIEMVVEPEQHHAVERAEAIQRAKDVCGSVREILVVEAIASEGDIRAGAQRLYVDPATRRVCDFRNQEHAVAVTRKVARGVAARLAAA